jgi:hypothetical protein
MDSSQNDERLRKRREGDRRRREAETPQQRRARLDQMREYSQRHREAETAEQRRARLDRMKEYSQKRRTTQSDDQKVTRLANNSRCQKERISNETEKQRAERLAQNGHCQQQRLLSETVEQRTTRISTNSKCQKRRLSLETTNDSKARRQRYVDAKRGITTDTSVLMLTDPYVIDKIKQYHSDLSNITLSSCAICHELQFDSHASYNNVCRRCNHDSSSPKLYSIDNNMDPGPVPSKLQVILYIDFIIVVLYHYN